MAHESVSLPYFIAISSLFISGGRWQVGNGKRINSSCTVNCSLSLSVAGKMLQKNKKDAGEEEVLA
jgi:hypothetical protein